LTLQPQLVERFRSLIADRSGLKLPAWVVAARVEERIDAIDVDSAERYCNLITVASGWRELELLIESLRVGETSFFRHEAQMKAIAELVAPTLASARHPVRVWSAGCASGEEPYSIAMLLRDALPSRVGLSITACDISEEALSEARAGIYPEASIERVPEKLRGASFEPAHPGYVRVVEKVRKLVRFNRRNLADGDFPGGYDLVLCRNVLIYFSPEAKARAIEGLIASVKPGGYLVVGYAESLRDFSKLTPEQTPDAVIYHRPRHAQPAHAASPRTPKASAPRKEPTTIDAPIEDSTAVIELHGRYEDESDRLTKELTRALSGRFDRVVIAVDGADYLGDQAGLVLKRAVSAATAIGVAISFQAERPGARRWISRLGFSPGEAS